MVALLAHHEAGTSLLLLAATLGGPALLALRCWLWERKHGGTKDEDQSTTTGGQHGTFEE